VGILRNLTQMFHLALHQPPVDATKTKLKKSEGKSLIN